MTTQKPDWPDLAGQESWDQHSFMFNQQRGWTCIPTRYTCTEHLYTPHIYIHMWSATQTTHSCRALVLTDHSSSLILLPSLADQVCYWEYMYIVSLSIYMHMYSSWAHVQTVQQMPLDPSLHLLVHGHMSPWGCTEELERKITGRWDRQCWSGTECSPTTILISKQLSPALLIPWSLCFRILLLPRIT